MSHEPFAIDPYAWSSETFQVPMGTSPVVAASTILYEPMDVPYTLTEEMVGSNRWYGYENQRYPSITTVLGATDNEGKEALRQWRQRIGHDAASAITKKAVTRGNHWHKFCEYFIARKPIWSFLTEPNYIPYASTVADILNIRVKRVVASEVRVCSPELRVAGRIDMAAELQDGRYVILDFKTGRSQKSGHRLDNYALQTTFYAKALSSLFPISGIVIMQMLPAEIVWQESVPSVWESRLEERIRQFYLSVDQVSL